MPVSENPHLYALLAGESSGDTLGAGLMMAIKRRDPDAQFIGIGGPKMIHQGLVTSADMSELSVMGFFEVLSKLPKILSIRKKIIGILLKAKPCIFIGIDLPDFNLHVEMKLKQAGIPTVHYVSPSVWAWREKRVDKIKKACDEILALLPFEKTWYAQRNMACTYVGHTLANSIPLEIDPKVCRERICLQKTSVEPVKDKVMAILPGSRRGMISRMLPIYAHTARIIKKKLPDTVFICTVPNYSLASLVKDIWLEVAPDLSITVYVGNTQDAIASADAVLLTCGTIALETMLLKTPFTVAYKVSSLSALIAKKLLKIDVFSLPNLIAGRKVVKEFIQDECTPQALAEEMYKLLVYDNILMKKEFENIHQSMRCNSDELACDAVFKIINRAYDSTPNLESVASMQAPEYSAPENTENLKTDNSESVEKSELKSE
ncbi:lipid-A-disaccharide synthase [Succinivibrio dextrinosolvens]|uniref:lipid-A-disaccharide synthase n=1 Tax=Succinivibrio dextrinosolvens TaxID=83771 RepID=UPI0008E9BCCA|nr:lipid-A-disaccharide synthase [Succinivibrio dextrinosolvens]SFS42008.1 lipid-A-disaccharide synthase [Succinivibrio dextrinosolvens]